MAPCWYFVCLVAGWFRELAQHLWHFLSEFGWSWYPEAICLLSLALPAEWASWRSFPLSDWLNPSGLWTLGAVLLSCKSESSFKIFIQDILLKSHLDIINPHHWFSNAQAAHLVLPYWSLSAGPSASWVLTWARQSYYGTHPKRTIPMLVVGGAKQDIARRRGILDQTRLFWRKTVWRDGSCGGIVHWLELTVVKPSRWSLWV